MKFLRWLFYLPIAILASFIWTGIMNIVGQLLFGWFKITSAMACMAAGMLGASMLILVSQKIAPNYNKIVKASLFLTLLVLAGFQISNFFYDFGHEGNLTFSELSFRSAQSFLGIGLLFGLLMINAEISDENSTEIDNDIKN